MYAVAPAWTLQTHATGTRLTPALLSSPEVWLRGALPDVPALLQPVAHSLRQSLEEVQAVVSGLDAAALTARPDGAASIDYHLRHAAGSVDRLFTYARGEALSREQLSALSAEKSESSLTDLELIARFVQIIERALAQLRATDPATLLEPRDVGRARLPSTVLGLLFHAAEHTQRHVGQLTTTARIVRDRAARADATSDPSP